MTRPASSPNDQATTLRNLKVLVVLLVVSNILVGVLSVYLLRAVDRRYSELVGQSVPALNDVRELMSQAVAGMRSTNPNNFVGPTKDAAVALQTARARLASVQNFRGETLKNSYFSAHPEAGAAIVQAGLEFERAGAEVSRLYAQGRIAEVAALRDEKVLPSFDRYVAAIGSASDAIEAGSLATSKDYTVRTNSLTAIVLGVASWPLLALVGLLLLTAVFVIAMMIAFRGKDLADMP